MKGCKIVKPSASTDKLILDIFMEILEAVESKGDLLSFLLSCRTLYTQGKHLMLRNPRIDASNLESFYAYMHSHAPTSFEALQDLHISIPVRYEGTQFINILEQGKTKIQGLLLSSLPKLGGHHLYRAITSLTNLRTLDLSNVCSDGWIKDMLSHLESSLTELVIVIDCYRGVLPFLSRSCRSLKRLSLSCDILPAADGPLSSLVMLNLEVERYPQLPDLMAIFPNLQDLRIHGHTDQGSRGLALLRKQNLVFQNGGHRWTSLRRLSANVSLLYAMALQLDLDMLSVTTPIVPADPASASLPDSPEDSPSDANEDSLSYSSEDPLTETSEGPPSTPLKTLFLILLKTCSVTPPKTCSR
ncbi:hypothetical protein EIP86_007003 [Pleurotus ostreatoroseus]|nr:hypothetical protein EIP86_007003 [Pleurotus ostreatoroseus]